MVCRKSTGYSRSAAHAVRALVLMLRTMVAFLFLLLKLRCLFACGRCRRGGCRRGRGRCRSCCRCGCLRKRAGAEDCSHEGGQKLVHRVVLIEETGLWRYRYRMERDPMRSHARDAMRGLTSKWPTHHHAVWCTRQRLSTRRLTVRRCAGPGLDVSQPIATDIGRSEPTLLRALTPSAERLQTAVSPLSL